MRSSRVAGSVAIRVVASLLPLIGGAATAAEVAVDLSGHRADSGVDVRRDGDRLVVGWPMAEGESGRLVLDLRAGMPLVASLGIAPDGASAAKALLEEVDPATFVTVGTRGPGEERPPGMSRFNSFFDSPAQRPHEQFRSQLDLKRARVDSRGGRATIRLGDLAIGPFAGELHLTVYAGARLVHVEAVVKTEEKDRAFFYDAGLVSSAPGWRGLAWKDTEGTFRREEVDPGAKDRAIAVRHRAIVAEAEAGSVACFPPPHQFFFPRDLTENLRTAWAGRDHRGLDGRAGFGVRQAATGGGNYSPWYSAPPGTEQRLGVFYLLSRGRADEALREVLRYTRDDRFADLPGHRTFTSHWHMATAVAAMKEKERGGDRSTPDFVAMFKGMNVDIVHLAEFHGDGHPGDPGPVRLAELAAMFDECRRLSDADLLFLPGEEANVHLGPRRPSNPGHWLYLFPRPVYWTMRRAPGQPFEEEREPFGTVYHVGDRDDMFRLLRRERGLAWTAHPRIKASTWAPDIYRDEDYFQSDAWLGAAWKAMPADLSRPKLGERSLDLLDDMANWGRRKQVLGEVDVFKIDHTHELYGHMNINYVRLDRLPRFDDGWRPILEALRGGRFTTTTGEVLIREFAVDGKGSGETLSLGSAGKPELRLTLEWTFPPRFAEVISGDGAKVYRERVDLADAGPFGRRTLTLRPDLRGRSWVRVEAWDVAANGAFSQPIWIESAGGH